MNLLATLSLTPKGVEEVMNRAYKLNIRKRSVLILLGKPQTVEFILQKTVFQHEEIIEEIGELINEGFIVAKGWSTTTAATVVAGESGGGNGSFRLLADIILSEAKFLLVDFCVDSFGTQSQEFVDELGECKTENSLHMCLRNIIAATEKKCPERLPVLQDVVKEINETA